MTASLVGAWLGAVAGLGLLLILRGLPVRRRPALDQRIAPYIRDVSAPSRLLAPVSPMSGSLLALLRDRVVARAVRRLDTVLGGTASIRSRLDELGEGSVEQVRIDQVVWGGSALGVVLGLGLLRAATGSPPSPVPLLLVSLAAALAAVTARDRALSRQVARRRERILAEFPTVAELLALSVAAGEGAAGALERVSRLCSGALGAEVGRTLADVRAGATLVHALQGLADRSALPVLPSLRRRGHHRGRARQPRWPRCFGPRRSTYARPGAATSSRRPPSARSR